MSDTPAWLGVDWGTSTLRVWAVADSQKVLQSAEPDQGMSALQPGAFEAALLSLVSQWLPSKCVMPVIACGMVGARQGWMEAPYVSVPCKPLNAGSMVTAATKDARLHVRIVPVKTHWQNATQQHWPAREHPQQHTLVTNWCSPAWPACSARCTETATDYA